MIDSLIMTLLSTQSEILQNYTGHPTGSGGAGAALFYFTIIGALIGGIMLFFLSVYMDYKRDKQRAKPQLKKLSYINKSERL